MDHQVLSYEVTFAMLSSPINYISEAGPYIYYTNGISRNYGRHMIVIMSQITTRGP